MGKLLFSLMCIVIIFGCTTKKEVETEKFVINNDILLENLKEYYNKNLSKEHFEYVLIIDFIQKEDTSVYSISYSMNLSALLNNPPLFYLNILNINVAIRTNLLAFIEPSTEYQEQQLRKCLPTQYNEYMKNSEIPPPITYRKETWILKFKGKEFVSRNII